MYTFIGILENMTQLEDHIGFGQLSCYISPWEVVILHVAQHQCARLHPGEGYNYYITCYLGNINVDKVDVARLYNKVSFSFKRNYKADPAY